MSYKFGWEETPEMKLVAQHRREMMERLEKEIQHDRRKQEILVGISIFCYALALFIPLIARLK